METLTVFDLLKEYFELKDLVKRLKRERQIFSEFGGKCTGTKSGICFDKYIEPIIDYDDFCPYCKKRTDMTVEIIYNSRKAVSYILRLRGIVKKYKKNKF